eukprot:TRINITY_DN2001_c0_g1_i2.p2 TRINITY_DN2001_c0_g1~~TRINITY_DN2001_c0_g1_i2.p2  ORF type:complete len:221 (+),score=38.67 TRINITY_DN2001_c0_g1_i2:3-665(+)
MWATKCGGRGGFTAVVSQGWPLRSSICRQAQTRVCGIPAFSQTGVVSVRWCTGDQGDLVLDAPEDETLDKVGSKEEFWVRAVEDELRELQKRIFGAGLNSVVRHSDEAEDDPSENPLALFDDEGGVRDEDEDEDEDVEEDKHDDEDEDDGGGGGDDDDDDDEAAEWDMEDAEDNSTRGDWEAPFKEEEAIDKQVDMEGRYKGENRRQDPGGRQKKRFGVC